MVKIDINNELTYIDKVKKINEGKNPKYYILTMGCQLNENDSEKISGMIENMGYTLTDDILDADLVVYNTCCVRENAEEKLFGKLGEVKKQKEAKGTIIAIGGCMMQEQHIVDKIKNYSPTGLYLRGNHSFNKELDVNVKIEIVSKINKLRLPQIPTFGSLFESDNKSFLKYLKNDKINVIPKTFNPSKDNIKDLPKNEIVLKPDNSSAGENIIFGEDCNDDLWNQYLENVLKNPNDWVLQQRCELKKDKNGNYIDIAVYMADGEIKGFISRTSKDKVVNVGHGGSLKPVILNNEIYNKGLKTEHLFIFIYIICLLFLYF